MLAKVFDPKYFYEEVGNRVELNRCPWCNQGMTVESTIERRCSKCGYSDSTNVPYKLKLRFEITQDMELHSPIVVIALEPDGKESYRKEFVDRFIAEKYIAMLKPLCQ